MRGKTVGQRGSTSADHRTTTTHEPHPWFEEASGVANVTTHLGTSVFLHCRVNDLHGKTVSNGEWAKGEGEGDVPGIGAN